MTEPSDTFEFPPPRIGDRMARKCRTHWHVGVAWHDEDEGESGYYETYGAPLTLETAAQIVLGDPQ